MSRERLQQYEAGLRNMPSRLVRREYERAYAEYHELKASKPRLKALINLYRRMLEIAEREMERRAQSENQNSNGSTTQYGLSAMDIFEGEQDDGTSVLAVELPMEPLGRKRIYAENTEDSRTMLQELSADWLRLWPQIRSLFEDSAKELDLDNPVDSETLVGQVGRLEPGVFMADRCDIYLSLSSDDHPDWDFFLRDGQIIHFQPVF